MSGTPVNVLVTGGAGFIGANLCARLLADPAVDGVVALDDLSTGFRENLASVPAVRFVEGSILDPDALAEAMNGVRAIVHLAARPSVPRSVSDPLSSNRVNVDGTLAVLEAARRLPEMPYVVFASSSSVYGANPVLPKHEGLATYPRSPYGASKLAGESYVLAYQSSYALPALAFRFFNVFGPLQAPGHAYAAVVPTFVDEALNGRPLTVHGDGLQTRDFTYVATVADVIARAVTGRRTSELPVNLAFGTRYSLIDLVDFIEDLIGERVERNHIDARVGDVRDSQADNTALRALFPDVEPVGLRDGLAQTISWMRTRMV